jgi:hypothetical protein
MPKNCRRAGFDDSLQEFAGNSLASHGMTDGESGFGVLFQRLAEQCGRAGVNMHLHMNGMLKHFPAGFFGQTVKLANGCRVDEQWTGEMRRKLLKNRTQVLHLELFLTFLLAECAD